MPRGGSMDISFDLNESWFFTPEYSERLHGESGGAGLVPVRIPHTVKELPFSYCDERDYQAVCAYRRAIDVPVEWEGNRLLLHFGAVAHECEVFLNGVLAGSHACGYTAFAVDITEHVRYGEQNVIVLKVDSRESLDIPPYGGAIDYLTYGGVCREVKLLIKPQVYIEDVFAAATEKEGEAALACTVTLNGHVEGCALHAILSDERGAVVWESGDIGIERKETVLQSAVPGAKLWNTDDPVLYRLGVTLLQNGEETDKYAVRTGFRSCVFHADGFYLNGKKTKIRGLNRHQSWPYVGYAMPRRPQRLDADILKFELGLNAVRTSHYPQSPHFVERCDEIGLLVFTELPGWNHIGGKAWKEQAVQNARDMVTQYRNHPSVILWGVRINESADDDGFYTRTNAAAHLLDNTRQTGGVRNFRKSRLLEDVYTYNDFVHNGKNIGLEKKKKVTPDMGKAYLVTEYMGHMFPAKSYDNDAWREEHALRHAKVLDAAAREKDIAGSFGWCMTDYNTHKEFGSGDRVCHHGVMDLFRNPKPAAAVYASQQEDAPVLEVGGMEIGDRPAMYLDHVYAFTNADSVRLKRDGEQIAEFWPDKEFGAVAHPPVKIDDLIGTVLGKEEGYDEKTARNIKAAMKAILRYGEGGLPIKELLRIGFLMAAKKLKRSDFQRLIETYVMGWGSAPHYEFEAVKEGSVIAGVTKEPVTEARLTAMADTACLHEEGTYDVGTIRIRAVDQNGNLLPYCMEAVQATVEGPLEVIGPAIFPLRGGMGGTYVRTTGQTGGAAIILSTESLGEVCLRFVIE